MIVEVTIIKIRNVGVPIGETDPALVIAFLPPSAKRPLAKRPLSEAAKTATA